MTQLPRTANTEGNNETQGDFSPVPPGGYVVQVVKSEMKQTKKKDGNYLSLQMKIIEPEAYAGRVLWDNLNLVNPNPVAVEIANKALNSICDACGLQDVEDSEEFHGIPMGAIVKIKPATSQYPAKNEVSRYLSEADVREGGLGGSEDVGGDSEGPKSSLPWED